MPDYERLISQGVSHIEALFDLGYHFRQVDTIFDRVFA